MGSPRLLWMVMLVGCGDPEGDAPDLTVSLTVPITSANGTGASFLAKYVGASIAIEIVLDAVSVNHAATASCGETIAFTNQAIRSARGANAADVTTDLLDKLPAWAVALEACDDAAASSVSLVGTINELNLSFGCGLVPASAQQRDSDGFPHVSSFTATKCNAIILDVPAAYSIGNAGPAMTDFSLVIATGPSTIP